VIPIKYESITQVQVVGSAFGCTSHGKMLLPVVTYESVAVGEVFWEGWERAYLLDQGIRFSK